MRRVYSSLSQVVFYVLLFFFFVGSLVDNLFAGVWIIPSAYTIRHSRGYSKSALRNWLFQGSKDGQTWTTLSTHEDDGALHEPG